MAIALRTLDWFKRQLENFREEIRTFANFPTMFMALTKDDGGLALYKGWLRIIDADGETVADTFESRDYQELHRRGGRAVVVPEVPVLQAARLSRTAFIASGRWRA